MASTVQSMDAGVETKGVNVGKQGIEKGGSCKTPRGMGVPPMNHGQDARATLDAKGFCKSLS
jgi:hypothetical protein